MIKILRKLKIFFTKKTRNNTGSFDPNRLIGVEPLNAREETELRSMYFTCPNVRRLLNELDRRDELLKKKDHEIWRLIHRPSEGK